MKSLHIVIIVVLIISTIVTTNVFGQNITNLDDPYANPGPPPDPIFLVDNRNQIDNFLTNHEILIHYNANPVVSGSSPLDLEIKLANNGDLILDDKKYLILNNTHQAVVFWRFVPTLPGNYTLEKYNNGIHTSTTYFTVSDSKETFASPVLVSPFKQMQAQIPISNIECESSYKLVIKSEDGSPACVTPNTAQKLVERGWAFAGFTRGGGPVDTSTIQVRHADMIVVEDTGTTVIGNQTYYFTTLNDTLTSYHGTAAIPFTFHGIDFTLFPSVFSAGPPGSCGDTNFGAEVKFANMTHERLDVHIPGSPCIENYTETAFTNHENSQVGIEDYYGKIRLLVGGDIQPSSALQLSLLVNGQYQNPSEPVGIDVYLNNTTSKPLTLTGSGNWPRNDLTSGMCSNLPFGITILDGYYDEQNMTGAKSLLLYGTAPCPLLPQIKSYTFQPFSTKATQECDTLFSCTGLVDMKKHFDIGDYVDGNNLHQPFKIGTYTIIAGDKWGNVAIQHFTEANAVAYDNSSIAKGNQIEK